MNRKAFTLIELLVVVAIIGILAAVGVVAYNGYTGAAKVNVIKTNYNNYHKFIKSELTKCNNGLADKAFNISCPINKTDDLIRALNTECANGDLSKIGLIPNSHFFISLAIYLTTVVKLVFAAETFAAPVYPL